MSAEKCIEYVNSMSKEDFFRKVIRGAAKTREFSRAVTFGAEYLSDGEREALSLSLESAGLPCAHASAKELSAIVCAISARAVTVS